MIATILNVNAGSSGLTRRPDPRQVALILGEAGEVLPTNSLSDLEHAAAIAAEASVDRIAIWGGDGTVGATIGALVRAYRARRVPLPELCLLPGGTMNCIARCIGANGTPAGMLSRLVLAERDGREIHRELRTTLRIGPHHGFLFGVGLIPNVLQLYDSRGTRGALGALETFFRTVRKPEAFFAPFGALLTFARQEWEGFWTNLSGGGIDCLPLGFRPYLRATEQPGAFHFVAHDLGAWGAAYELFAIKLGYGMQRVKQDVIGRVVIELDRKLAFSLDGDSFDPVDRIELEAGPVISALVP